MRDFLELAFAYLWMIIHHRWIALLGAILLAACGWIGVGFIPDLYEVETRVYFDTKSVLKPLLEGLAVDNAIREQSAQLVRRTLFTRANLQKVITDSDLDINVTDDKGMERLLEKLRDRINIQTVDIPGLRSEQSNLYRIVYRHNDPAIAKKVVESILNIFVETILGSSRKDSDKAESFLDKQIKEYAKSLETAEERLKLFKQENAGMMPNEGSTYYSRLSGLKSSLDSATLELDEKQNERAALQRQIQNFLDLADDGSGAATPMIQDPLDARIGTLQAKLDELLLQYTERHPDVVSTRAALDELRRQKETQQNVVPGSVDQNDGRRANVVNSGLYQDLNVLLGGKEAEIAALQTRVAEYNRRIDDMNKLLTAIPEVEAELTRLNRDYDITRQTYNELVARRASAQLSRDAEQTSNETQFNIIEPPIAPVTPVSPDRIRYITLALFAGLLGGIGCAVLYEQLRPTFYTRKQIEEEMDLPVLGSVSMSWSPADIRKKRLEMLSYALVGVVFIGLYVMVIINRETIAMMSRLVIVSG